MSSKRFRKRLLRRRARSRGWTKTFRSFKKDIVGY